MVSTSAADRTGARSTRRGSLAVLVSILGLAACSSSSGAHKSSGVTAAPDGEPWKTLDEWHLFVDAKAQTPQARVVQYDVIAQLFSDYAFKRRFIYVPEGSHIDYKSADVWDLPVGSIFVKTFSFLADGKDPSKGEKLLETRLLVHEAGGWQPHTYVWDAAQTSAKLERGGTTIPSQVVDPSGNTLADNYAVPSESDCRECHGKLGETNTLGGKTRQLDRMHDYGKGPENQIDHLASLGFFSATPEPSAQRQRLVDPFDTAQDLTARIRAYFDGNCGHCHRPGDSNGSLSGLWLDYPSTAPGQSSANWGICKKPQSGTGCGRPLDVIPGQPDQSIMTCRVEATSSSGNVKMPPIGRNLVHAEGAALIREWITSLPGSCSAPPPPDAGTPATDSGTPSDAATADGPG